MGLLAVLTFGPAVAQSAAPALRLAQAPADKAAPAGKDDDDDDDKGAPAEKGGGKSADAGKEDGDGGDANKFPQPVRVGDLIGRAVIAPQESQNLIGRVRKIVRNGDGDVSVVMTYGGYFGFGTHLVCVSLDDLALTGYAIQAKEIEDGELARLPVCDGGADKVLAVDATIKVNLAKPAH